MAFTFDANNNLDVNIQTGVVTVTTATSTTASSPASTAVSNTSGQILAANASRKEVVVVNTGTTVIYLALGQTPTTSAYHIALAACTNPGDGTGGVYVSDIWLGAINAISGTSGTVCVTELT